MTHFYITLPSNSCMEYYKNTPQNFRIKFPKPLDLTGKDYEVGLSEIQYPRTWYLINNSNCRIEIIYANINDLSPEIYNNIDVNIPKGMYNTMDELINNINFVISKKVKNIKFICLPNLFKTRIKWIPNDETKDIDIVGIKLSNPLCRILGFEEAKIQDYKKGNAIDSLQENFGPTLFNISDWGESRYIDSPYPSDIKRGMYSLFVYSDLVSKQVVGDIHAPLLRAIPIEGSINTIVTKSFILPHYLPVSPQIYDTIEIDIRDDTGKPIRFSYGKVLIKLHFRLRRSPYFE